MSVLLGHWNPWNLILYVFFGHRTNGWIPSRKWVEPLMKGFSDYFDIKLMEISQRYEGIVFVHLDVRGVRHNLAIDYSDLPEIDEECARCCLVYFKMQFARNGCSMANVLPGGFVPRDNSIYQYLPHLRKLGSRRSSRFDVYGRFGLEFAKDIRSKACSLLAQQNTFHWGAAEVKI